MLSRAQYEEQKQEQITKDKPRPFKALFIARSDYGKSYQIALFINRLLQQRTFQAKRIFSFSKTYKTDDSQQLWIANAKSQYKDFEKTNCFEQVDFALIEKIYQGNKKIKEEYKGIPKPYLFVLDDQITEKILCNNSPLVSLFSLCRHYNISFCFSLQAYCNALGTLLRNQITMIALGQLSSQKATDSILEHFDGGLGENKKESMKIIKQWYNDALQQDNNHGFLVIDCTQSPWNGVKYQRCFTGFYYDTLK